MLVVSCLVLITLFLWCKYQWTNRRLIKAASSVPPIYRALPIVGNAPPTIRGLEAFTSVILEHFFIAVSKGLTTISIWIGPIPYICIWNPKDIQQVLTSSKSLEKADEYQFAEFVFGNGLVTAPGNIWKIKRKFARHMFDNSNLNGLMPSLNRNCRHLVLELSKYVDKGPFNIHPLIVHSGIISLSNLLFGVDIEFTKLTEEIRSLEHILESLTDIIMKQLTNVWLRFNPVFEFLYRKDLKEIKSTLNSLILYSNKMREKTGDTHKNISYTYHDILAAQNKEYPELGSDYNIQSDLLTMYIAGSDTTSITVSSCILALAKHTAVQDQLFGEIETVMGDREDVTVEDIQKMTYLEQVFQETLRWAIVFPFILRKASEDLELGDVTIPAGGSVVVALGAMHTNPTLFPNPKTFNPDNFSAEKRSARDPRSFLPFSAGSRNCIGKLYAAFLAKTMVVHMVRSYKITTAMDIDNLKKKITILLVNSEGYIVSLAKRK